MKARPLTIYLSSHGERISAPRPYSIRFLYLSKRRRQLAASWWPRAFSCSTRVSSVADAAGAWENCARTPWFELVLVSDRVHLCEGQTWMLFRKSAWTKAKTRDPSKSRRGLL